MGQYWKLQRKKKEDLKKQFILGHFFYACLYICSQCPIALCFQLKPHLKPFERPSCPGSYVCIQHITSDHQELPQVRPAPVRSASITWKQSSVYVPPPPRRLSVPWMSGEELNDPDNEAFQWLIYETESWRRWLNFTRCCLLGNNGHVQSVY